MEYKHLKFVLLGVLTGSLLVPSQVLGTPKPSPSKKANPVPPSVPAPVAAAPSPASLEQMPAAPPQVSFKSGELTIVAKNSSLGAILQEVQAQTGANIDMPTTPTERVVGQFGPGPAREVLASLLNGSHFNYVLLGSPQDPNSLDRVVLLSKSSESDQGSAATAPVLPQRQGTFSVSNQETEDTTSPDNAEEMAEPEPAPEEQADQNNGPQNAQPAIKTPQQLLQELQRQQQAPQQGAPSPQQNPLQK